MSSGRRRSPSCARPGGTQRADGPVERLKWVSSAPPADEEAAPEGAASLRYTAAAATGLNIVLTAPWPSSLTDVTSADPPGVGVLSACSVPDNPRLAQRVDAAVRSCLNAGVSPANPRGMGAAPGVPIPYPPDEGRSDVSAECRVVP